MTSNPVQLWFQNRFYQAETLGFTGSRSSEKSREQIDRQIDRQITKYIDRQILDNIDYRQITQIDRQITQIDRQIDRQIEKNSPCIWGIEKLRN